SVCSHAEVAHLVSAEGRTGMEPVDGSDIEVLVNASARGARALVAAATHAVVARLGERGSCVLVTEVPRVVFSTEFPSLVDFSLHLPRYPEIAAAVASKDVVIIDDVATSPLLAPVAHLLPARLRAVAVVPLLAEQRCLGVIIVQSSAPRDSSTAAVSAVRLDGRVVGSLLDQRWGGELARQLGCAPTPPVAGAARADAADSHLATGWDDRVPAMADGGPERTRRRLLIADDDSEDASWLAELLTDEGFEVHCAVNGADAVYQARQAPPDLMLLDVHMPVMDGFSAAAELAQDPRTMAIPILFLSAAEDLMSRIRQFDRECVDFLRKPYSFLELVARIEKSLKQADSRKHLRLNANIDELTGLGNLRCLREHIQKEQSRMGRTGSALTIVMIDVDKLKRINDDHGHVVGSRVLKAIGETLHSEIRPTDLAVRYGGDEFVVLLPHTQTEDGVAFAERALARINALRPEGIEITLSVGVAGVNGLAGLSVDGLLARADSAAYRAKRLGGNRVCKHGDGDAAADDGATTSSAAPTTVSVVPHGA
ncbi:MAG: diguanylate cyclase, partial [Polyangia bacterium]